MNLRASLIAWLCLMMGLGGLPAPMAHAARGQSGLSLDRDEIPAIPAADFVFRNYPGESLITVSLLGAVHRPGLYHLPVDTDLVTALSLAGGPTENADLDDLVLSNPDRSPAPDLKEILKEGLSRGPALQPNAVVFIPAEKPLISSNTATTIGIVSTLLGIVLSAIVISKNLD